MIIRPYTPADLNQCAAIHKASRRVSEHGIIFESDLDRQSVEDIKMRWMEWTSNPDCHVWISEDEKIIKGFVMFGPVKTRPAFDKGVVPRYSAEIYALYVHPNHFREGIGRQLFLAAVEKLNDMKLTSLILWALKKNKRACGFYGSFGGEKIGKQRVDMGEKSWAEESCFGWRDIRKIPR